MVYINRQSDEATVRRFVADLDIGFPVLLDTDGTISSRYNIKIEPQTVFISPDHKLLGAILGGVSEADLKSLLGKYLDKKTEKQ